MLITLEGLDGSGKSSAVEALQERTGDLLPADTVFTREPTGSWYGDAVARSIADEEADPLAELFLYTADHAAHLADTVRPALAEDRIVVSDRYADSRYAYQGATLAGALQDPVEYVQSVHAPWTVPPDLTIYLDIHPEIAAERSGATNKFETASYLEAVRENYEQLIAAEPERFIRIDATQSKAAVRTAIARALEDHLAAD
jgi:dTMP kinase